MAQSTCTNELPPPSGKRTQAKNIVRGGVDVRTQLFKLTGVDLFSISGLGADTLLTLVGEVGVDMQPWKTEKHFTSWLALCPGTRTSNRKILSTKTRRSSSRAAAAFRIAATTLGRSKTALGAFYRRISARVGAPQAVTATARKIAVIYYSMLKYGTQFVEIGQAAYEQKYQRRRLKGIKQQALALGYQLVQSNEFLRSAISLALSLRTYGAQQLSSELSRSINIWPLCGQS